MTLITFLQKNKIFRFSQPQISLFIFILLGLIAAFNHSLWRDEMQGWLVAWKSATLYELWENNAPSGHPVLWSLLIYLVKDITKSPLSMQLLHWVLGCFALLCFWRWNPLPNWQKTLFTFGYYPFWEYYFICRHYVLAELFTFIFCSSYPLRRKTYIPAALCVGLLVNTHAMAWAIACGICLMLLIEWFFDSNQRYIYCQNRFWIFDLTLSIFILVCLTAFAGFSLIQVREVVDVSANLDFRHLLRVVGRLFGGYLLIIPNSQKWLDLIVCTLITIGLVTTTLSYLRRSTNASIFFIFASGSLFLFNYFLYLGVGSRHYGYYFLILIASIWLALNKEKNPAIELDTKITNNLITNRLSKLFPHLLTFCLAIHFAAGVHRSLYDFHVPYSAGKAAASYIKDKGWSDQQIFGTRDVELSTVSGYLDRDIYYPELEDWASYTQWNNRVSIPRKDTLIYLNKFFSDHPKTDRLLLILSSGSAFRDMQPGDEMVQGPLRIRADRKFEKSWVYPERFYLYWAERLDPGIVDEIPFPM